MYIYLKRLTTYLKYLLCICLSCLLWGILCPPFLECKVQCFCALSFSPMSLFWNKISPKVSSVFNIYKKELLRWKWWPGIMPTLPSSLAQKTSRYSGPGVPPYSSVVLFQALLSVPSLLLTPNPRLLVLVNGNSSLPTAQVRSLCIILDSFLFPSPVHQQVSSAVLPKSKTCLSSEGLLSSWCECSCWPMTYQLENQTRGQER